MPIKRAAYKDLRKAKLRHQKNISTKTELKTLAKKFERLVAEKKLDDAKKLAPQVFSKFDKAAQKKIISRNSAARKISRLMKKLSSSKA